MQLSQRRRRFSYVAPIRIDHAQQRAEARTISPPCSAQQPFSNCAQIAEFHAHTLAGDDVTHNRLGLNKAPRNFKKQRQFGADRPYLVGRKVEPPEPRVLTRETCESPPPYQATVRPLGRQNTLVSADGGFALHNLGARAGVRPSEANSTRVPGRPYRSPIGRGGRTAGVPKQLNIRTLQDRRYRSAW